MKTYTIKLVNRETNDIVRIFSYYKEETMLDELCTMLHLIIDGTHHLLVKASTPDEFRIIALPKTDMEGSYISLTISSTSVYYIRTFDIEDDIFHSGSEMVDCLEYVMNRADEMLLASAED